MHQNELATFEPGAATTSRARSIPNASNEAAVVKRWTSSRKPPCAILITIVCAWVIQEWLVIEQMVWPDADGDGDGDGGVGTLWIARVVAFVLAVTVASGLWMTHFLDPGVIPPKKEVDAAVSWFLALNTPRANVTSHGGGGDRGGGGGGGTEGGESHPEGAGMEEGLVARFSKDFKGQPIKSVFPERLLDPEDPEGPLLKGGVMAGDRSPGWGCNLICCIYFASTYCTFSKQPLKP